MGLQLVGELADDHGAQYEHEHKLVWASVQKPVCGPRSAPGDAEPRSGQRLARGLTRVSGGRTTTIASVLGMPDVC